MKEHIMSKTSNVMAGIQTIDYLLQRPKSELVGLGLIYGRPGLGKTRFARRIASEQGYLWMKLDATSTTKTFVQELFNGLKYSGGQINEVPVGTTNGIFTRCLELLSDMPNTVIILDEIDYAFQDKKLLGTVRDIVDETTAALVMVGMGDARNQLLKANSHYFDRCNSFCEFKPLTLADIRLVISDICDYKVADDLSHHLWKVTGGNLRQTVKLLNLVEKIGKAKHLSTVSLKDTGKLHV